MLGFCNWLRFCCKMSQDQLLTWHSLYAYIIDRLRDVPWFGDFYCLLHKHKSNIFDTNSYKHSLCKDILDKNFLFSKIENSFRNLPNIEL